MSMGSPMSLSDALAALHEARTKIGAMQAEVERLRPIAIAAEALSAKWRTAGQKVDSDDFFHAINAVDVAVTGGGAKRNWETHPLTTSEHIAADMKAGRFPKQSDAETAMREIEARASLDSQGHSSGKPA